MCLRLSPEGFPRHSRPTRLLVEGTRQDLRTLPRTRLTRHKTLPTHRLRLGTHLHNRGEILRVESVQIGAHEASLLAHHFFGWTHTVHHLERSRLVKKCFEVLLESKPNV